MTDIVLSGEETQCLAEGGYTMRDVDGRKLRLMHEAYETGNPRPWHFAADDHITLSAAEVAIIAREPAGLIVGATTIRSEVAR